jgi:DNA-binding MarR family transcriptional regulator
MGPVAPYAPADPAPNRSEAAVLVETARRLTRAASRAAGPGERRELTGAQMELLLLIRREPDLPVAEAAARLRLARNTVSTLVGQLVTAGVLERGADAQDGRVVRLRITDAADQRMARWRARRVGAVQTALATLEESDRQALRAAIPALERAAAVLEAQRAQHDEYADAEQP